MLKYCVTLKHFSLESRPPSVTLIERTCLFPFPASPSSSSAIRTPPERNVCIPGRSPIWILNNFNFSVYEREKTIHLSDRRGITCHENICSAIPSAARSTLFHSVHLARIEGRPIGVHFKISISNQVRRLANYNISVGI